MKKVIVFVVVWGVMLRVKGRGEWGDVIVIMGIGYEEKWIF